MSDTTYYDGFTERWTKATDVLAAEHGVDSVLIMKSTPTHMVTAASGGAARDTYVPGGAGPKSVVPGHHKLYCEQVINTDRALHVPDAASDPQWRGNEDLVKFGFGFYLGVPVHDKSGTPIGTVCALHPSSPGGDDALEKLRASLSRLAREIEIDIDR
ncbi:MAG: GAF domain-containing protein [Spirochaetales bacterium]|nr:GAF domain-containing protein [Spirochaetales bacterium]